MRNINPMYILLFSIIVWIVMLIQNSKIKEKILQEQESYAQSAKIAKELYKLKTVYDNSKKTKQLIATLLNNSMLRSFDITKKVTSRGILFSIKGINKKGLDYIFSKLLNNNYKISLIEIKRVNDAKANLKMEILW